MISRPSRTVSIDIPIPSVKVTSVRVPPGNCDFQEDAKSRIGPQKKPNPTIGKTVKKTRPTKFGFAGQISPNPILCNGSTQPEFSRKIRALASLLPWGTHVVRVMTEQ